MLLKYDKNKPVYLEIVGVDKKFATSLGIIHYMEDNFLVDCEIITTQNRIEVKHKLNRTFISI